MKVLVVGSKGQLGRGLISTAPPEAEVVGHDIDTLDVTEGAAVRACIDGLRPALVFNAAAYTAVDKAESDEETAFGVNATAVGLLSATSRECGARFVHVSTDFVFDGLSGIPYLTDASPRPLGVYGRSKLEGERLAGPDALIVRTAWVYAPAGGNFVRTMLRLMAQGADVRVVADQIGTPTYAPSLAVALWKLAMIEARGIYHYTDSGVASWYDFAVAIQEEALAIGLLDRTVPIVPIATEDYPTPARRPHYSVLDKRATEAALCSAAPHWRSNLRIMLSEIKANG
jgi:dTDP-4-dehydrorhamnose reductase